MSWGLRFGRFGLFGASGAGGGLENIADPGDVLLINGIDALLINGTDRLRIF